MNNRIYLCIDLKSFYASVECVERGLDPLKTNLVVADPTRSRGTICLAVSPSLKQLGVRNRCRVFEIPSSISYIMAPPRMKLYIDYSAEIYGIYLKYIAKEDIQVYSIDEAFLDVTDYLPLYHKTARELGIQILNDIRDTLGVVATCGIGTNLYLAKVALDITAKHSDDFIGYLTEDTYCKTLWNHRPITDFWRVGRGIASRLIKHRCLGILVVGSFRCLHAFHCFQCLHVILRKSQCRHYTDIVQILFIKKTICRVAQILTRCPQSRKHCDSKRRNN